MASFERLVEARCEIEGEAFGLTDKQIVTLKKTVVELLIDKTKSNEASEDDDDAEKDDDDAEPDVDAADAADHDDDGCDDDNDDVASTDKLATTTKEVVDALSSLVKQAFKGGKVRKPKDVDVAFSLASLVFALEINNLRRKRQIDGKNERKKERSRRNN